MKSLFVLALVLTTGMAHAFTCDINGDENVLQKFKCTFSDSRKDIKVKIRCSEDFQGFMMHKGYNEIATDEHSVSQSNIYNVDDKQFYSFESVGMMVEVDITSGRGFFSKTYNSTFSYGSGNNMKTLKGTCNN